MMKNHPLLVTPIAHRGLHDEAIDENSLFAYSAAIKNKLNIEIDLHLISSGELLVVHDFNIKRVTGADKEVKDLTLADLDKYLLLKKQAKMPLFEEVLNLVDGKVGLLVELKVKGKFDEKLVDKTLEVLENYKYKDSVALQSFNPYCVKYLKKVQNIYPVGQLTTQEQPEQTKFVSFMFKHLFILKISKPDFLAADIRYMPKKKIIKLRKKGLPILAWTIDSEEKKNTALKYADNIIFERIKL